MSVPKTPSLHLRRKACRKRGFALVISLSLMSFVILVVVMLATQLRLQAARSLAERATSEARETARLGLVFSFSALMDNLSEDQRSSAVAEMLTADVVPQTRHWTGVWNTAGTPDTPRWLVSGNNPSAASVAGGRLLVGRETAGTEAANQVIVPEVGLGSGGAFSWWIGDEGVKASLGVLDRFDEVNHDPYRANPFLRQKIRLLAGSVFDVEERFSASAETSISHVLRAGQLSYPTQTVFQNTISRGQIGLHSPDSGGGMGRNDFRNNFHSYTLANQFVLSNTLDGGLRQDLSHLNRLPLDVSSATLAATFNQPAWEYIAPALQRYVGFHRTLPAHVINATPPVISPDVVATHMDDLVAFSTAPAVTEFAWNASIAVRNLPGGPGGTPTQDIILYFYTVAEILNPYPLPLRLGNGTGAFPGDPSDVIIRISNLPTITVRNLTQSIEDTIDLSELVIAAAVNSFNNHAPGYMRPNFAPTGAYNWETGSAGATESQRRGVFAIKIGELSALPDVRDDFEVIFGESNVRLELRESNVNSINNANDRQQWVFFNGINPPFVGANWLAPDSDPTQVTRLFQTIELQNWGEFSIFYDGDEDQIRFVRGATNIRRNSIFGGGGINDGLTNFGIHAKFVDEWNETLAIDDDGNNFFQPLDDLFTFSDLRRRQIVIDMNNPLDGDGAFFDVANPDDIQRSNLTRSDDTFQGAEIGSDLNNRIARFYELPTFELASVGALNHLIFGDLPPQPLGNTVRDRGRGDLQGNGLAPGGNINNFFDRYFFSTLPSAPSSWDRESPLVNHRYRFFDDGSGGADADLGSPGSARRLMVHGGFNVNSTSPDAWNALLNHSVIDRFFYTRAGETMERSRMIYLPQPVRRIFHSRPFSGTSQIESTSPRYGYIGPESVAAFTSGIRTTGPHEVMIQGFRELTAAQATDLAAEIASRVRDYGVNQQRGFSTLTEFVRSGILQDAIDAVPSINQSGSSRIPQLSPAFFSAGMVMDALAPYLFARSDTFVVRASGTGPSRFGETAAVAYCEAVFQRVPQENALGTGRDFILLEFRWLTEEQL